MYDNLPFENRIAAGRQLALSLQGRALQDPIVMALPPGGVPVALEVARALHAELDLIMVRRLGVPGQAELAMGAVANGGIRLRNNPLIREAEIGDEEFREVRRLESVELQHHEVIYRGFRPTPRVRERSVILVDDGLASGTAMRAAILAARRLRPLEILVAVPVASAAGIESVARDADEVLCLVTPDPLLSVGLCYREFAPVSEDEVRTMLESHCRGPESELEETSVESELEEAAVPNVIEAVCP